MVTVATIDRLPQGYFRHPSAAVAVHFAHDLAGWPAPEHELPDAAPAPVYESELR